MLIAATDIVTGSISTREWVTAGAILLGGLVLGSVVRRIVRRVLLRSGERVDLVPVDATAASLVARLVQLAIVTFALLYALLMLGVQVGPLFAALGIGGVAIAFAMRDTLENLIAGLILQLRRPFVIGDHVVLGIHEGTIRDVGFRYVQLARLDGTDVLLPARRVLDDAIVNTSTGTPRRTTIRLVVPAGTDPIALRTALQDGLHDAPSVLDQPAPDALLVGIGRDGAEVQLRFWHDPSAADALRATDEVVERALRATASDAHA